jgi:hemerythrin-like domain-containing protein
MRPTDFLMSEHRVIEQVLACLDKMADQCAAGGALDVPAARQAIDFLEHFAAQCHDGKEEKLLFPLLEKRGFAHDRGPIVRMLYEHWLGRRFLAALVGALDLASIGHSTAVRQFAEQAHEYAYWLRRHIAHEDEHLFPAANRAFSTEDQRALLHSFEDKQNHEMATHTHEKYVHLANDLADRLRVPRVQPSSADGPAGTGCGHHAYA